MNTGNGRAGFSLLETMVVMAIAVILSALLIPAANQILRGSTITQAGDRVFGILSLARQYAVTRNRTVEVRFYGYADSTAVGSTRQFRAVQSFAVDETGLCSAMGKAEVLDGSVIMDSGAELSPLLSGSFSRIWDANNSQISIPRAGTSYICMAFRFLPDGSTSLPAVGQAWFVTLHNAHDGDGLTAADVGAGKKIKNYETVQIDPVSGSLRIYRP